tara:strand:+ start:377 stop:1303 length:927 start_codon:yes stop_codon:yes gene_type:complete
MVSVDLEKGITPGRATTLEGLLNKLTAMGTREGMENGLAMTLAPSDIVITPFGKSGTTWLQQMAHTMRTRGDMDFDDISRVVPWIENSTDLGLDLDAPQKAQPRLFKSHLDAHRMPKGGRYIIACRDPKDAAYSMFKFMEGWFMEPGAIALDDFVRALFIASGRSPDNRRGDYWTHLTSWWHRRNDPDVLFMAYEHMKDDLPGTIHTVAAFMDIALDDELMAITEEHASLPFMQQHKDRFDDKLMRERAMAVSGLPADSEASKVRDGKVGQSRQALGADVARELDELWQERVTKELGYSDYASMIATL